MVIVDDHIALRAIAGADLTGLPPGPVATTYSFHYRLARALLDPTVAGVLSREADAGRALARVLRPPADRLVVLDPRESIAKAVDVSVRHRANLLLAELVGAALHLGAAVRVTKQNSGRAWPAIMRDEGVDFSVL